MVRRTWDAVVVGGGVVGCAVLRELTVRRGWRCLLVERQPHLVAGASAGNTGIACTASDVATGTVEHACLSEGARLNLPAWTELNVPHRPTGSMYAAFDADGLSRLEAELEMRRARGDPDAALLTAAEARAREPALVPSVLGALLVAGEVAVDPWLAPIAYARHAHENGATIQRGREVAAAAWEGGRWRLTLSPAEAEAEGPEVVEASVVVACGGLLGDALEALHRRPPFAIQPRRGDFLLFDGSARALVGATPVGQPPGDVSRGASRPGAPRPRDGAR